MKPYPHSYVVEASADPGGRVALHASGLPELESAPPEEFDGPGDRWSPETLLVGAVADCFVLTFHAIAGASKLAWKRLHASATGTLEPAEGGARFTSVQVEATLVLPPGGDEARGLRLLEKAERGCLITRSLRCPTTLVTHIESDPR